MKAKILLFFICILGLQAYSQITCNMSLGDGAGGFKNGETYNPGDVVYITGAGGLSATFPATGAVYILYDNNSSDGYNSVTLVDVLSLVPNVIQSYLTGGQYFDEIIAIGPLPEGKYDIAIDKNGNGVYNVGTDCFLGVGTDFAFEVRAGTIPLWKLLELAEMKLDAFASLAAAQEQLEAGKRTFAVIEAFRLLGDLTKAVSGGKGALGVVVKKTFEKVTGVKLSYDGMVIDKGKTIVNTVLEVNKVHYQGIAADPPDHDYFSIAPTEKIQYWRQESNHPYVNFQANLANSYAIENIALDGIFHSMEKIQGATADHMDAYTRLQALGLIKYINLWKEASLFKLAAADSIITYMVANNMTDTIDIQKAQILKERIINTGFDQEELQDLVGKFNLSQADLDTIRNHFSVIDTSLIYQGTGMEYLINLKNFFDSVEVTMDSLKLNAQTIVTNIDPTLGDIWPAASITVPPSVILGNSVTLSGTNTNTSISSWQWDLDKDSLYNDGSSQNVVFTPTKAGLYLVSLKVTNQYGKTDYAYAIVNVKMGNKPAVISSNTPAQDYVVIDGSQFPVFSINATDPESDAINYTWASNGNTASTTTNSYNSANDTAISNSITSCKRRLHELFVEAIDAGSGYKTGYIWNVLVDPVPTIKLPNDTALCNGCTLTLDATSFSHASYSWSTGQTTPIISASNPGTYFVQVSANGCSSIDSIVISAVTSSSIPTDYFTSVDIYPNPSHNDFQLEYSLQEESMVRIEVYNLLGKLIETIVDDKQPSGTYKRTLSPIGWGDNNIYFVKLSVNNNYSLVKKVVLIK